MPRSVFEGPKLYPRDPYLAYQARLWTKAVDEDLHPACSAITYVVSHRHTIIKNGVANFEDFLKSPSNESLEARKLKWQWIAHGLEAPGAADRIRLYDRYLHKMEDTLRERLWLAGDRILDRRYRADALRQPAGHDGHERDVAKRPPAARRRLVRAHHGARTHSRPP